MKALHITLVSIGSLVIIWIVVSAIILILTPGSLFNNKVSWASVPNYGYEKEFLQLDDGLKFSFFRFEEQSNSNKPVILYLHGNTGRVIDIIDDLRSDHNVYSPAYPGYSESEGDPTPETVLETSVKAYDYMVNGLGIEEQNIIIFGHSMGGSPATYLASKKPNARKLVLANTFSSVQSMCFRSYSIFCVFTGGILNSSQYAKDVNIPVSQFAYKGDTTVPFEEGKKLNEYFNNSTNNKFIELDSFTHTHLDFNEIRKELN